MTVPRSGYNYGCNYIANEPEVETVWPVLPVKWPLYTLDCFNELFKKYIFVLANVLSFVSLFFYIYRVDKISINWNYLYDYDSYIRVIVITIASIL